MRPQYSRVWRGRQRSTKPGLIKVHTDTLDLVIDTRGGTIVDARLMQYPVAVNKPDEKYRLLSQRPSDFFIVQSGLLGAETERTPTHEAVFTAASDSFELKEGEDSLTVDLQWQSPDGVRVVKRYTFNRGSYVVQLEHLVNNGSDTVWSGRDYRQLQRGEPVGIRQCFDVHLYGWCDFQPGRQVSEVRFR